MRGAAAFIRAKPQHFVASLGQWSGTVAVFATLANMRSAIGALRTCMGTERSAARVRTSPRIPNARRPAPPKRSFPRRALRTLPAFAVPCWPTSEIATCKNAAARRARGDDNSGTAWGRFSLDCPADRTPGRLC